MENNRDEGKGKRPRKNRTKKIKGRRRRIEKETKKE
jgi:hypothetical protein